jgi:hypothetical protein
MVTAYSIEHCIKPKLALTFFPQKQWSVKQHSLFNLPPPPKKPKQIMTIFSIKKKKKSCDSTKHQSIQLQNFYSSCKTTVFTRRQIYLKLITHKILFTFELVPSEEAPGLELLFADIAGDAPEDHLLAGWAVDQLHVLLQVALPVEGGAAQLAPVVAQEPLLAPPLLAHALNLNEQFFCSVWRIRIPESGGKKAPYPGSATLLLFRRYKSKPNTRTQ